MRLAFNRNGAGANSLGASHCAATRLWVSWCWPRCGRMSLATPSASAGSSSRWKDATTPSTIHSMLIRAAAASGSKSKAAARSRHHGAHPRCEPRSAPGVAASKPREPSRCRLTTRWLRRSASCPAAHRPQVSASSPRNRQARLGRSGVQAGTSVEAVKRRARAEERSKRTRLGRPANGSAPGAPVNFGSTFVNSRFSTSGRRSSSLHAHTQLSTSPGSGSSPDSAWCRRATAPSVRDCQAGEGGKRLAAQSIARPSAWSP